MSFFKKKEKPVVTVQQCPADGCTYTTTELSDMKKHVEWKHPELAEKGDLVSESMK